MQGLRTILLTVFGLFILITATPGISQADEEALSAGRAVMEEQDRRHKIDTEFTRWSMVLKDRKGRERVRDMVSYMKQSDQGLPRTLIKYLAPKDIKNVGLLTWSQPEGKDDDQWLYLPASRQTKRISSGSKKNPFMGSDLAFEDLRSENLEAHDYSLLREEAIDSVMCFVVEAVPNNSAEKKASGYGKRQLWIRKDNYITIKTDFYNKRDRLAKTGIYSNLVNPEGEIWRSNKQEVTTLKKKTTTSLITVARELNPDIDAKLFETGTLPRPLKID